MAKVALILAIIFLAGCVSNSQPASTTTNDLTVNTQESAPPIDVIQDDRPTLECIFTSDSVTTTMNDPNGYGGYNHAYAIKMFFKNPNDVDIENVVVTIKTDTSKIDSNIKFHYGTTKIYPVGKITAHSTVERTFDWHEDSYWGGGDVKFIVEADNAKPSEECGPTTGRDVVISSS